MGDDQATSPLGMRHNPDIDEFDVDGDSHPPRCSHPSSSGIDDTPVDDPAKVWLCHCCDAHHLADGTRILAPEIEARWDNFWADIVTRRDGTIDIDQVKAELHDYWTCIEEVPKVYGDITGNTLSKPNYLASEVIAVHNERCPNVTNLIEDIREVLEGRGGYDDLIDSVDQVEQLKEILQSHETLHSSMYREERQRKEAAT